MNVKHRGKAEHSVFQVVVGGGSPRDHFNLGPALRQTQDSRWRCHSQNSILTLKLQSKWVSLLQLEQGFRFQVGHFFDKVLFCLWPQTLCAAKGTNYSPDILTAVQRQPPLWIVCWYGHIKTDEEFFCLLVRTATRCTRPIYFVDFAADEWLLHSWLLVWLILRLVVIQ